MQPPQSLSPQPVTPQQAAIRAVRERYERGDLSFDAFKQALDDLLEARDEDECQAIMRALPVSPADKLKALDLPVTVTPVPTALPALPAKRSGWLVMLMGELKRTKRRWRLAERTNCLLVMGEVRLDLSMATLPHQGVLRLFGLMGEMTVYVPRNVAVRVRSCVLLGEANALGESTGGICAMGHAESHGPESEPDTSQEPPVAYLDINAFLCMGEITVKQVDTPAVTIAETSRAAGMLPQPR
ncbi:MAG TPA: LiaF domain-containing protein [Ktedonobacterales bacterium]|nr:LiaF domain-containing protein [Ktedonobacterales bacterium]